MDRKDKNERIKRVDDCLEENLAKALERTAKDDAERRLQLKLDGDWGTDGGQNTD